MTKKDLNQNGIYAQKLIDTIETEFVFSNEPINRYKIVDIKDNIIQNTSLKNY